MPRKEDIKKVLVIGSGPIVIGQAAEFDYAGTQACRILKNEGINVVLCNCNPATIMTDSALADEIYLEPLTTDTLKRIIIKERPDSLLASLGGQTGLTLGCQLAKEGFLDKYGVKLIGVKLDSIDRAEDRELFKETMQKINQPVVPSDIAYTVDDCVKIAEKIGGYPVIVRPAYTLGGAGGGVAHSEEELRLIAHNGLMLSPITQVLIEKYIAGWKEIEFEVIRDCAGNVITVCSMENFDPVGVHTGDSIVIAPAVTLSDKEYQMLRSASLNIISELGIEGGCNCQFALKPDSFEYSVIEVNPRVSRSSALASKATGFPIAKVATKIALGYTLDEIKNDVTGITYAAFEPTIDYVVVKLPKWPFDKFLYAKRNLGTRMKATGEVMSIGTSFEMAIMKAVRGAEISLGTLNMPKLEKCTDEEIHEKLHELTDERLFVVFQAIKRGISIEEINRITTIDPWFLNKLKNLCDFERSIEGKPLNKETYIKGKKLGYPDKELERISGNKLPKHVNACFKMVDTCAAEFAAQTPYFYSTYDEKEHDEAAPFVARSRQNKKKRIIVIGSGPIRIGQGIEFDYSSVHCVWALKRLGYEVIIINNNPETVSTDFDTADRLYFESLTPEDVQSVIDVEKPYGVVITFGGQTAIKLCAYLDKKGVRILGTPADSVDLAEDRERFDALLEQFSIARPKGLTVMSKDEAVAAAEQLGYPVLLRPSYVIGGQNMTIAFTQNDIERYMDVILAQKIENPVLCDKYLMGLELEVDAISDGVDVLIPGIMQHIERAGVHSGDSIAVYPPYNLSDAMLKKIVDVSTNLAISLKTKGLINIQFLIYHNELYVIEVNPRASRTVPYISKVTGVPMVDLATKIMLGYKLKKLGYGTGLYRNSPYVAVKVPVFSFEKLNDVNSQLGPEMKSTGEVLGIGKTIEEALFKGLVSAGFNMKHPTKQNPSGIYFTINDHDKFEIVNIVKKFADLGLTLYATKGTAKVIRSLGLECTDVARLSSNDEIFKLMDEGKIDYVVYTGKTDIESITNYISMHHHAILLGITVLTSLDTANALADVIAGRYNQFNTELVDINNLRTEKLKLDFSKLHCCGNDYILFNNMDGKITCPESLAINFCDRHFAIGADGIVMIEKSDIADAKVRVFNRDGSDGGIAANPIRCAAKYLYDSCFINCDEFTIESCGVAKKVSINHINGVASSVAEVLGTPKVTENNSFAVLSAVDGYHCNKSYSVEVGNKHCVIFCDNVDDVDIEDIGQTLIMTGAIKPDEYVEFVRVVNNVTVKVRAWDKSNGETLSCGTAAAAAALSAIKSGECKSDEIINVKLKGGDLFVKLNENGEAELDGSVKQTYKGIIEI
ncbi:MAG: carbamoyl-phosphate synthase large subunit [Candidatus Coproplasma sp.]